MGDRGVAILATLPGKATQEEISRLGPGRLRARVEQRGEISTLRNIDGVRVFQPANVLLEPRAKTCLAR
jgi:hypothetical protein